MVSLKFGVGNRAVRNSYGHALLVRNLQTYSPWADSGGSAERGPKFGWRRGFETEMLRASTKPRSRRRRLGWGMSKGFPPTDIRGLAERREHPSKKILVLSKRHRIPLVEMWFRKLTSCQKTFVNRTRISAYRREYSASVVLIAGLYSG